MNPKEPINKYMTLYMSLGMCFGVAVGMLFGMMFFPENFTIGMCFGVAIGMGIGMTIGFAKDAQLAERMMTIVRIREAENGAGSVICAVDKNGVEKEFLVDPDTMAEEKFAVEDRVAEETDGSLFSLESK